MYNLYLLFLHPCNYLGPDILPLLLPSRGTPLPTRRYGLRGRLNVELACVLPMERHVWLLAVQTVTLHRAISGCKQPPSQLLPEVLQQKPNP